MLAFNDIFWMFAWFTAVLVPLTFLMRPAKGGAADRMPGDAH